jgi:hypothetical protein
MVVITAQNRDGAEHPVRHAMNVGSGTREVVSLREPTPTSGRTGDAWTPMEVRTRRRFGLPQHAVRRHH